MNSSNKFECDCCGQCCRHIFLSNLYRELDRGDGVCIYLDDSTFLCKIYESRPLKCNVDEIYKSFFCLQMSKEHYYQLNKRFCKKLKNNMEDD